MSLLVSWAAAAYRVDCSLSSSAALAISDSESVGQSCGPINDAVYKPGHSCISPSPLSMSSCKPGENSYTTPNRLRIL